MLKPFSAEHSSTRVWKLDGSGRSPGPSGSGLEQPPLPRASVSTHSLPRPRPEARQRVHTAARGWARAHSGAEGAGLARTLPFLPRSPSVPRARPQPRVSRLPGWRPTSELQKEEGGHIQNVLRARTPHEDRREESSAPQNARERPTLQAFGQSERRRCRHV